MVTFDSDSLSVSLKEPLEDEQFKPLLIHEIGHALLLEHLGRIPPEELGAIIEDSLKPFYQEFVFPNFDVMREASKRSLATTYIESCAEEWEKSVQNADASDAMFDNSWNELFCNMFALYWLSKLEEIPVAVAQFLSPLECVLKEIGFA